MKVIHYLASWYHTVYDGSSVAKYEAGKCYPVTDESLTHVAQGIAEEVDAPDDVEAAQAAADKAQVKVEKAVDAALDAEVAARAAEAAQEIAAAADAAPAADAAAADTAPTE